MRITIEQLKKIIKEEVEKGVMDENPSSKELSIEELAAAINADPEKFFSQPEVKDALELAKKEDPTFVDQVKDAAEEVMSEGFVDKATKFTKRHAKELGLAASAVPYTAAIAGALASHNTYALAGGFTSDVTSLALLLSPAAVAALLAALGIAKNIEDDERANFNKRRVDQDIAFRASLTKGKHVKESQSRASSHSELHNIIKEEVGKAMTEGSKHLPHEEQEKRTAMKKDIKDIISAIMPTLSSTHELTAQDVQKQSELLDKIQSWMALDAQQRQDHPDYFKGTKPKTPEEEFRIGIPSSAHMDDLKKEFGITERRKQRHAARKA